MNAEDISRIKEKLNEIEKIDIAKIAVEKYQNQDIKDIILAAGFSVVQTITFLKRLVVQFNSIFEDEDSLILPNVFTFNEYDSPSGQNNVLGYLNHIIAHVETKNFDEISKSVKWLIAYQMNFGFWNQSEKRVHDVNVLKLNEKKEEIKILLEQVNDLKEQYDTLKINIEKEKEGLNTFIKLKQEELQTITNTLGKVSNEADQINSYWKNASQLDSEINTIKSNWNGQFQELKKQMEKQESDFDEQFNIADEKVKILNISIADSEEKNERFQIELGSILEQKKFIDERKEQIEQLLGFAVDASLGVTFNRRKSELRLPLILWLIGIFLMTGGSLYWVYLVFTQFPTQLNTEWLSTLINTIKTLPAFVLLFFVSKQYSKERNLQEEYAFKAAVAMTLKAFGDQLSNETDEDRRAMLRAAINNLYTTPKISQEPVGVFPFRSKMYRETLKTVSDLAQKLVDKK